MEWRRREELFIGDEDELMVLLKAFLYLWSSSCSGV